MALLLVIAETSIAHDTTAVGIALTIIAMLGSTLLVVVGIAVKLGGIGQKIHTHGEQLVEHRDTLKRHADRFDDHGRAIAALEATSPPREPTGRHRAHTGRG